MQTLVDFESVASVPVASLLYQSAMEELVMRREAGMLIKA